MCIAGVSSFGDETCSCGVTGSCDGGPQTKCNCDELSKRWSKKDGGPIVSLDRLPVCEVSHTEFTFFTKVDPIGPENQNLLNLI